jgi:RNA polymerase sigma-70 factor, ECF subfamily
MGRGCSRKVIDRLAVRESIVQAIPQLRGFAVSLRRNTERADDLVQETLLRALSKIDLFEPGTNLIAWLFTILHNQFRSDCRKRVREVEDCDGRFADSLISPSEQDGHIGFEELRHALDKLPADQREAVVLVGGGGMSYGETAEICGCAVGTIKSRVFRAREKLAALLKIENEEYSTVDSVEQSLMVGSKNTEIRLGL